MSNIKTDNSDLEWQEQKHLEFLDVQFKNSIKALLKIKISLKDLQKQLSL